MLCAVSTDRDCWYCRELDPWPGTYGAQPDKFLVGLAANSLGKFHVLLFRELDRILARTQPRKSVVFALDGPAPLAKLLTQRCAAVCFRGNLMLVPPGQQAFSKADAVCARSCCVLSLVHL